MTVIVFQRLTRGNRFWARVAAAMKWDVRYLNIAPALADDFERLKQQDIHPIDFEALDRVDPTISDSDSLCAIDRCTDALVNSSMLDAAARLIPAIKDGPQKVRIAMRERAEFFALDAGRINCWIAAAEPRKTYVVTVDTLTSYLVGVPGRSIVRITGIGSVLRPLASLLSRASDHRRWTGPNNQRVRSAESVLAHGEEPTVAFFPHQGLAYGTLFRKDQFYAARPESPLHPSRLLHIDLHDSPHSDPSLRWVALNPGPLAQRLKDALTALKLILPHVRSFAQLIGAVELAIIVARVRGYVRQLARFSGLKVALLDHDLLFPKSVALALQGCGILTIAMQDRFTPAFSHAASLIAEVYLAASRNSCNALRDNRNRVIGSCVAVGLVRSDKLGDLDRERPRKNVVALPYHVRESLLGNAGEPFMNWRSHHVFLSDVLRLAKAVPDCDFIIRGKNCDWMALTEFSEIVAEIGVAPNVSVSTNYDRFDESYRLCAKAVLVIAKHTSLGDECISAGIPTVFHDYGCNYRALVSPIFDYGNSLIWAHDAEQLDKVVTDHLLGRSQNLQAAIDDLRQRVFGNLTDGSVKERVVSLIESFATDVERVPQLIGELV